MSSVIALFVSIYTPTVGLHRFKQSNNIVITLCFSYTAELVFKLSNFYHISISRKLYIRVLSVSEFVWTVCLLFTHQ